MVIGVIFCFLAILWLGTAVMLGYSIYDCWDYSSGFVSFLLICGVVAALVECILFMCIGIAYIVGCQ